MPTEALCPKLLHRFVNVWLTKDCMLYNYSKFGKNFLHTVKHLVDN